MGTVICFANQKGGVGKTTSAVNVAASLGVLRKNVLLVDMDPQGNATSGLGVLKRNLQVSSLDVLLGKESVENAIIKTEYKNVSLIPSSMALASAEFELSEIEDGEKLLKNALEPVKNNYDYIIIDAPPSLGLITVNILTACDRVIIPMQLEFYALEGLSQLTMTIDVVKSRYNPHLAIGGILITMYNPRLLLSTQVKKELEEHYGYVLFKSTVSRSVRISEAPGFGKPVYYHDRWSKGSREYVDVAKELIKLM